MKRVLKGIRWCTSWFSTTGTGRCVASCKKSCYGSFPHAPYAPYQFHFFASNTLYQKIYTCSQTSPLAWYSRDWKFYFILAQQSHFRINRTSTLWSWQTCKSKFLLLQNPFWIPTRLGKLWKFFSALFENSNYLSCSIVCSILGFQIQLAWRASQLMKACHMIFYLYIYI